MQEDFEPILERQIHHLINYAQGIMHIGQRDIAWLRVGKGAVEKGFRLSHLGKILHAKFHQDFGAIFDKVQVKVYTETKSRWTKCLPRQETSIEKGMPESKE